VAKALEKRGVTDGDTVVIGELELEWSSDRSEGKLFDQWQVGKPASREFAFTFLVSHPFHQVVVGGLALVWSSDWSEGMLDL